MGERRPGPCRLSHGTVPAALSLRARHCCMYVHLAPDRHCAVLGATHLPWCVAGISSLATICACRVVSPAAFFMPYGVTAGCSGSWRALMCCFGLVLCCLASAAMLACEVRDRGSSCPAQLGRTRNVFLHDVVLYCTRQLRNVAAPACSAAFRSAVRWWVVQYEVAPEYPHTAGGTTSSEWVACCQWYSLVSDPAPGRRQGSPVSCIGELRCRLGRPIEIICPWCEMLDDEQTRAANGGHGREK